MHFFECSGSFFKLVVLKRAWAGNNDDLAHDLHETHLEHARLQGLDHGEVDLRNHLLLLPHPEDNTPVALAGQSYKVLFVIRESAAQELLASDGQVLHLMFGQGELFALIVQLVDHDLCVGGCALTNRQKSFLRRHTDEVDLAGVVGCRDETLSLEVQVIEDHIIASDVNELLLIIHVQRVVNLAIHTKCDARPHRDTRLAHIGNHGSVPCLFYFC